MQTEFSRENASVSVKSHDRSFFWSGLAEVIMVMASCHVGVRQVLFQPHLNKNVTGFIKSSK